MKKRCQWVSSAQIDMDYHDNEWGIPIYDKFKLKTGGNLYNYSQLSIKNNPRLDIMYTK